MEAPTYSEHQLKALPAGSMEEVERRSPQGFLRSGIVAGAASAIGFAAVHDLFISDIWDMLTVMTVAGALCGLSMAWSYRRIFETPSVGSWLRYNLIYLAMFGLLGAVSLLVFEPVTTVAAINAEGGPVDDLIVQALPMTVAFAFITAGLISLPFKRTWSHYRVNLLTVTVLVVFLGLNVSVVGLVEFGAGEAYLVAELFGLILAINIVFVGAFTALEWKNLTRA